MKCSSITTKVTKLGFCFFLLTTSVSTCLAAGSRSGVQSAPAVKPAHVEEIKDPTVKRLVAGYQETVPAERAYCSAIQGIVNGDFYSVEAANRRMQEVLQQGRSPRFYVARLQGLLVSKRADQRREALVAFGTLIDGVQCWSEWNLFDSKNSTLVGKLRGLSTREPDPGVRAEAKITLEKWTAAAPKWNKR
jgi:hypothetical protein